MPALVLNLRSADDPRDHVHRAVESLTDGKLVVFPTESFYCVAASALHEGALARFTDLCGRAAPGDVRLALKTGQELYDYIPELPALVNRLTRRCWPGPVVLQIADSHPDGAAKQLPAAAQKAVLVDGYLATQSPAHEALHETLRYMAGPLVLGVVATGLGGDHAGGAVTSAEALAAVGDKVDLVLDDGRCKLGQPTSLVRVSAGGWSTPREGVISAATLRRMASFMVLFVCTGNTCRSPMAEALMKARLAARLGCRIGELENHGVLVQSAGISAMAGGEPSPEAVRVLSQRGVDLSAHESQPLTERLARSADLILALTRRHKEAVQSAWPETAPRVALLRHDGGDVADPIGGPEETYERCAAQIEAEVEEWARRLDVA